MDDTAAIDPMTMARFLVMPEATALLDAFSRIPPGPLRAATVAQVQAMADTYSSARPEDRMADPLFTAASSVAGPPKPTPALESPTPPYIEGRQRGGTAKSLEERVIDMRMHGKRAQTIAKKLKAPRQKVTAILGAATRGGLRFPPVTDVQPGKTFPVSRDALSGQGQAQMEKSAVRLGLGLDAYLAARAQFLELRADRVPIEDIAKQLRVPKETCLKWLYAARMAGINLPLYFEDRPDQGATGSVVDLAHARTKKG